MRKEYISRCSHKSQGEIFAFLIFLMCNITSPDAGAGGVPAHGQGRPKNRRSDRGRRGIAPRGREAGPARSGASCANRHRMIQHGKESPRVGPVVPAAAGETAVIPQARPKNGLPRQYAHGLATTGTVRWRFVGEWAQDRRAVPSRPLPSACGSQKKEVEDHLLRWRFSISSLFLRDQCL